MVWGIMQKEVSIECLLRGVWDEVCQGNNRIGHGGLISHQARDGDDCISGCIIPIQWSGGWCRVELRVGCNGDKFCRVATW